MDSMLDWGLSFIRGVQTVSSPPLTAAVGVVTLAGDELFYLLALPLLFWCADQRKAFRLGMLMFFSTFLNAWLKGLLAVERPFARDPSVGLGAASGFSTPSGHAQLSATFWGGIAAVWGRRILVLPAILLPLLIGFSRIYLGVHYPTDVFLGWAIGAFLALAWASLGERAAAFLASVNVRIRIGLVAALAWLMCFLHRADVSAAAGFFGVGLGYILNAEKIGFTATGGAAKKALRVLLGGGVLAALYFGAKRFLPGEGSELYALYRFLSYALIGFWVSAGAPWAFLKLGLAERAEVNAPAQGGSLDGKPR